MSEKNRTVALICRTPKGATIFRVTEDGQADRYIARVACSDFGLAYSVEKVGVTPRPYRVVIADHVGYRACDCMGANRWGNCRHLGAILALRAAGKMP
jgi:hypothetical protein